MNNKENMQYVQYIVNRYLSNKPELRFLQDELFQEGYLAFLKAIDTYDSSKGVDRQYYIYYRVLYRIQEYIKLETKHFKKPYNPDDPNGESPRWELYEYLDLEEIPIEYKDYEYSLKDLLTYINISDYAKEILKDYLSCDNYEDVARKHNITRQAVRDRVQSIIKKLREYVNG